MQDARSPVAVNEEQGVRVVEFTDSKILDEANIEQIGHRLFEIIGSAPKPKILLDFANVDHLSSAALGKLLQAREKVRDVNGQLRLCDIKPQIFEVFTITKLDKLFRVYPTRTDAMASFDT